MQKNRDRFTEYQREWTQENQEHRRNYEKEYYRQNVDRIRETHKEYARTPEGKHAIRRKDHKRRATKKNVLSLPYTRQEIQERFAYFDNSCAYCGCSESLTIDHLQAIAKSGIDAIDNIVPACLSCNSSKGDRDLIQWYVKQDFFSPSRFKSIANFIPLEPR